MAFQAAQGQHAQITEVGSCGTGKKHLMSPGQRCVVGGGARKGKAAGKEGRAGDPVGEVGRGQFQKIPGC